MDDVRLPTPAAPNRGRFSARFPCSRPSPTSLCFPTASACPGIGFGTWQVPADSTLENAISAALELGYRFIDTAQIYGNASVIGRSLLASGLPREEVYISSKIWTSHRSYDGVMRAFTDIIEQLKTPYLDQLLFTGRPLRANP